MEILFSIQSLPDSALIEAVAASDSSALSELYSRYAKLLVSIAYRFLHNRTDAEDLLHDVFLEVWHKAGNYDQSRGTVRTWLVLVTRSRALDRMRKLAIARKWQMAAESAEDDTFPGSDPAESAERLFFASAVEALSERQRKVLVMNFFEGLSCEEIAAQLDTPLGTVKSRLRAAIRNLRVTYVNSEYET
jgi:RNA polymerase sigma-70 factor (ECF subfamily)